MLNFRPPTEVVKNLLIINCIVFGCVYFLFPQYANRLAFYHPQMDFFRPYQIVSHFFMHGSFQHLFFNMFSLYIFGPMVEQMMGARRFLMFYFLCALGSLTLHVALTYAGFLAINISLVGASGAIMGVAIAFAMYFPNMRLMLLFPPIPIKAMYLVAVWVLIDLFSGVGGYNTGIAHFAHLGGALTGFIIMLFWRNGGNNDRGIQRWN